MTTRDDLLRALEEAKTAIDADRTRKAKRAIERARALVVLLVPAVPLGVCSECELGGGHHVEGCPAAGAHDKEEMVSG